MIAQIVLRLVMRDVDIVFIRGPGRNSIYSYYVTELWQPSGATFATSGRANKNCAKCLAWTLPRANRREALWQVATGRRVRKPRVWLAIHRDASRVIRLPSLK
jgi:hypothetical protein